MLDKNGRNGRRYDAIEDDAIVGIYPTPAGEDGTATQNGSHLKKSPSRDIMSNLSDDEDNNTNSSQDSSSQSASSLNPQDILTKRSRINKILNFMGYYTKKYAFSVGRAFLNFGYDFIHKIFDFFDVALATPTRVLGVFDNINASYTYLDIFGSQQTVYAVDSVLGATAIIFGPVYAANQYYKQNYYNESTKTNYILGRINLLRQTYTDSHFENPDNPDNLNAYKTKTYLKSAHADAKLLEGLQHVLPKYEVSRNPNPDKTEWHFKSDVPEDGKGLEDDTLYLKTELDEKNVSDSDSPSYKVSIQYVTKDDKKLQIVKLNPKNKFDDKIYKKVKELEEIKKIKIEDTDADDYDENKDESNKFIPFFQYLAIKYSSKPEIIHNKAALIKAIKEDQKAKKIAELEQEIKKQLTEKIYKHLKLRARLLEELQEFLYDQNLTTRHFFSAMTMEEDKATALDPNEFRLIEYFEIIDANKGIKKQKWKLDFFDASGIKRTIHVNKDNCSKLKKLLSSKNPTDIRNFLRRNENKINLREEFAKFPTKHTQSRWPLIIQIHNLLNTQLDFLTNKEIFLTISDKEPDSSSAIKNSLHLIKTENGWKFIHYNEDGIKQPEINLTDPKKQNEYKKINKILEGKTPQDFARENEKINLKSAFKSYKDNNTLKFEEELPNGEKVYYIAKPKIRAKLDPTTMEGDDEDGDDGKGDEEDSKLNTLLSSLKNFALKPWGYVKKILSGFDHYIVGPIFGEYTMAFWVMWFPVYMAVGSVVGIPALGVLILAAAPLLFRAGIKLLSKLIPQKISDEKIALDEYQESLKKEALRKAGKYLFIQELKQKNLANGFEPYGRSYALSKFSSKDIRKLQQLIGPYFSIIKDIDPNKDDYQEIVFTNETILDIKNRLQGMRTDLNKDDINNLIAQFVINDVWERLLTENNIQVSSESETIFDASQFNHGKYTDVLENQGLLTLTSAMNGFQAGFLPTQFFAWAIYVLGLGFAHFPYVLNLFGATAIFNAHAVSVLHNIGIALIGKTTFAGLFIPGILTGPVGICVIFGITFAFGLIYAAKAAYESKLKQNKEFARKNKLIEMKDLTNADNQALRLNKVQKLDIIEHYNNELKDKIKKLGLEPFNMPAPDNDRAYRRLSEKAVTWPSQIKFGLQAVFLTVWRIGTGVLDGRLIGLGGTILPLIFLGSVVNPLPAIAFFTLAGIGAVVVLTAAIIKWRTEVKREKEVRLLEDIDLRTDTLLHEHDLLQKQYEAVVSPKAAHLAKMQDKLHKLDEDLKKLEAKFSPSKKPDGFKEIRRILTNSNNNNAFHNLLLIQKIAKERLEKTFATLGRDKEVKNFYREIVSTNYYLEYNDALEQKSPTTSATAVLEKLKEIVSDKAFWRDQTASGATPTHIKKIRDILNVKNRDLTASNPEKVKPKYKDDTMTDNEKLRQIQNIGSRRWEAGLSMFSRQREPTHCFYGLVKSINERNLDMINIELKDFAKDRKIGYHFSFS